MRSMRRRIRRPNRKRGDIWSGPGLSCRTGGSGLFLRPFWQCAFAFCSFSHQSAACVAAESIWQGRVLATSGARGATKARVPGGSCASFSPRKRGETYVYLDCCCCGRSRSGLLLCFPQAEVSALSHQKACVEGRISGQVLVPELQYDIENVAVSFPVTGKKTAGEEGGNNETKNHLL